MNAAPDSAAFHGALAARRDYLNAVFRREGRSVDAAVFMAHLRDVVGPLVDAVAGADADLAAELATTLFRLTLRAHRQGLLGGDAPSPALARALTITLPTLLPLFPGRPRDVSLAMCNAALRLERLDAERAARWLETMESLGPSCADHDALFSLGLVLAWRAGAAEYHEAAHARFEGLSPTLRRASMGVETLPADPARRFAAPLEEGPLGAPEIVAELGGFVGFGGVFHDPPLLSVADGRVFAFDSRSTTEVFADAFGAALRHVADPPDTQDSGVGSPLSLSASGKLGLDESESVLTLLANASSHAWANGVGAVTLPHSHFVFVVGRRPST